LPDLSRNFGDIKVYGKNEQNTSAARVKGAQDFASRYNRLTPPASVY
jgi:hypothetical protein